MSLGAGGSSRRVAIFGLDGADLDLLRPWLEEGRLPCLSRIYREGAHGRLASTVPPMSPEAWSSFATGNNPGKHGVVNFVQPKPGSYDLRFCTGALRRGKAFWELAGEAGMRVGIVNVPMTYPPRAVNGFLISGLDAPGVQAEFTYPRELKQELLAAVGSYEMHGDYWGRVTASEYLRRLIATVEDHQRAWQYLIQRFRPQLFVGVFGSTDRAQHFLWRYADASRRGRELRGGDPLLAVYQAVDRAIAECLALLGDQVTTIVMSDHGGGPCDKAVYLDRWLQEQGLLSYRVVKEGWRRAAMRRSYRWARGYLPRSLKDLLKTRWSQARQQLEGSLLRDPIDWERTRAFFLGTESAYVYLNVRGRFPQGTVEPGEEAARLSQQIREELSRLTDPETGQPVVESIHERDEIYWGQAEEVALLPDLVVTWRDYRYVVRRAWGEPAASPKAMVERGLRTGDAGHLMSLELSGCHRPYGVLLVHGPGIQPGLEIENARITDLAPTVLSLLSLPLPADTDGRALPLPTATSRGRDSPGSGTRGRTR